MNSFYLKIFNKLRAVYNIIIREIICFLFLIIVEYLGFIYFDKANDITFPGEYKLIKLSPNWRQNAEKENC